MITTFCSRICSGTMAAKVCSRLLELIIVKHKEYMKVITDVQRQLINSAFNLALPEMQRALEEDFDNESKNEGNPGYDEYRMSFEAFEKLNARYEAFKESGNELSDELLVTVTGGVGKCLGEIEWNVTNEYTLDSKDDKTDRKSTPSELQSRQYLVCRLLLEKKNHGARSHIRKLELVQSHGTLTDRL